MMIPKPLLISIIDDDVYTFTLTRIINHYKLAKKILPFSDGEKALDFLTDNVSTKENIPDIIFLDCNMPIMDGWQFIDEYARLEAKIKKKVLIFMVSSSVNSGDIEKAKKIAQISDYIIKPIMHKEVNEIIQSYL